MSFKRHIDFSRLFIYVTVALLAVSVHAQTPIDTTKERQPYPEPRSAIGDVLAVPGYILEIPFSILKGITNFVVDEMQVGPMASKAIATVGDIKKSTGFYPSFGTGGRSGVQFGLGFNSSPVWTEQERLKLKAMYSTHDYLNLKAQYRVPNFINENFEVRLLTQHRQQPWELFFGLGNYRSENDKVNYNPEHSVFQASGLWTPAPNWEFEFKAGYNVYNLFDGEDPKLEGHMDDIVSKFSGDGFTSDLVRSTRFWTAGTAINHDWRNHKGQPTSGGQEIVSIAYNSSTRDFDELEFWRVSVDLRHYLELFKKRTLALRVLVESVDISDNSTPLPFYLKSGLGGPDNLRGYRQSRFLDNDVVLASLEYRYPLLEVIDAFVFVDEGRVFSNLSNDFKWHDWKYSYGGGIRIFNSQTVLIRTFVAKSKEDTRFNLEFSNAF
ncbi:MAG: hypothetical protein ACREBV_01760 [Candidatus Zixiibacteriota bacterium]